MRENIEVLQIEKEIESLEQKYLQLKKLHADDEAIKKSLTQQREAILEKIIALQEDGILILYKKYKQSKSQS